MGGQRFKSHEPVRLPAPAALEIQADVVRRLEAIGIAAFPTITFPGKADYGDLDIVIAEEDLLIHAGPPSEDVSPAHQAREALLPVLGALQMARSGPTDHATSYLLPTEHGAFQVDLITHPRSVVPYANRFYAWGDLGALVSMTARRLGLTNKATGLYVVVGDVHDRHRIRVITDYNEALTAMGFNASRHEAGFASPEEAFAWLADSHHFDPETYKLENLTGKSRTRAAKRPHQIAFRQWLEDTQPPARDRLVFGQDADGSWATRDYQNEHMLRHWRAKFPHIVAEEQDHLNRVKLQKAAKQARRDLMSAPTIASKTGLAGEELKVLMWQMTKHPRYAEMQEEASPELLDLIVRETQDRLAA